MFPQYNQNSGTKDEESELFPQDFPHQHQLKSDVNCLLDSSVYATLKLFASNQNTISY
jgi:hypothetical protein